MNIKYFKRNPLEASLFCVAVLLLILHSGDISAMLYRNRELRKQSIAEQQKTAELLIGQDQAKERSEIARRRYEGCIPVVAFNAPDMFTALSEGQPVIDAARKSPLPAGSVVCDAFGNTGVVSHQEVDLDGDGSANVYPIVTDMAFTGDKAVVDRAMARVPSRFQVPGQ